MIKGDAPGDGAWVPGLLCAGQSIQKSLNFWRNPYAPLTCRLVATPGFTPICGLLSCLAARKAFQARRQRLSMP